MQKNPKLTRNKRRNAVRLTEKASQTLQDVLDAPSQPTATPPPQQAAPPRPPTQRQLKRQLRAERTQEVRLQKAPLAEKKVADSEFIKSQFHAFYDAKTGTYSKAHQQGQVRLYKNMSMFDSRYLQEPMSDPDLVFEYAKDDRFDLQAQNHAYDYPTALVKGDYFHFVNNYLEVPDKYLTRRLVVNTYSQESAVKLTDALIELYDDDEVGGSISEFKTFLSAVPLAETPKADKVVVYYHPDETVTDSDRVGTKIAQVITSVLDEKERDPNLAPFYEHIATGIGWSDEVKTNSFTTIRQQLIERVVEENPHVTDEEEFYNLVMDKFRRYRVDTENTHQYMVTGTSVPGPKIT
ncbi:hypothetical protein [Nonomuraea rhizosphaerae]|uniref:hypothetical protein n=1 Tax=Nonomuraea rhizosphaerae TaxID=2665663 RepID=UPI001C5FE2B4|nr:hypothetical protein [Nonomuraea rhizosphaerae]